MSEVSVGNTFNISPPIEILHSWVLGDGLTGMNEWSPAIGVGTWIQCIVIPDGWGYELGSRNRYVPALGSVTLEFSGMNLITIPIEYQNQVVFPYPAIRCELFIYFAPGVVGRVSQLSIFPP